ncbi:hypothetical protein VNO78_33760 [Psophocarpus tetragonolobus]|uniref:Uncharacterized protein n=1 Tax=Psophocarpus tetragonolobus TaxID=3891 RepID=A0AAN9RQD3_PSOTE
MGSLWGLLLVIILPMCYCVDACSREKCKLKDKCSSDGDCKPGLFCFSCVYALQPSMCVRSSVTDQFKLVNNSLPFNKYAFLTTHNSFAIQGAPSHTLTEDARVTLINQEDSVTQQLKNGVRALMLDTYDFRGDIWLCHSMLGRCHDLTAFVPAINTMKEIAAFLSANPTEIVTIILEDYVKTPKGLTKLFTEAGLMKFWFPVKRMPKDGGDWPRVNKMVSKNRRLIVFTSEESKEKSEGIAYQWNYMVENKFGNGGTEAGKCSHRKESSPLDDKTKSLVLVNYFRTIPLKPFMCDDHSQRLIDMIQTCHTAAGNRWANFVAVDYYKRSRGGGSFQAVDTLNGRLMCGCDDVHACVSYFGLYKKHLPGESRPKPPRLELREDLEINLEYIKPEYVRGKASSVPYEVDLFFVLYEAFDDERKGVLEKIVDPFLIGKITSTCWDVFIEIIQRCLASVEVRPKMGEVEVILENVLL